MNYKFEEFVVLQKKSGPDNTFIFALACKNSTPVNFLSGQYFLIKNPKYKNPDEPHPFSIASTPTNKKFLEFCIKQYGFWTQALYRIKRGDILMLNGPYGKFTLKTSLKNIVFLVGGIGISPIISILRDVSEKKLPTQITLIYGNRTPKTIVYKKELYALTKQINLKIVHIFSDLEKEDKWKGYRGFITKDVIRKEVELKNNPTFFVVGPPIFIDKMDNALASLSVKKNKIRKELL